MAAQNRYVFVPLRILDVQAGQVDIPIPVNGTAKCVAYIRNAVINSQGPVTLYFTNNPCHRVWGLIVETQTSQSNFEEVYSDVITLLGCRDIQRVEIPQNMGIEIALARRIAIQRRHIEDNNARTIANNLRNVAQNNNINISSDLLEEFRRIISGSTIYFA